MYRAFLAIIISFLILVGYQYFFIKPTVNQPVAEQEVLQEKAAPEQYAGHMAPDTALSQPSSISPIQSVKVDQSARDITVETPLYTAVINEQGGGFKSFVLKGFEEENEADSAQVQLVQTNLLTELPMLFSLGSDIAPGLPVFRSEKEKMTIAEGSGEKGLVMTSSLPGDLELVRTLVFDPDSYLIDVTYTLKNNSPNALTISPSISLTNQPFVEATAASRFMFSGPVAFINNELQEVKGKKLNKGPQSFQGAISWAGYEDNYFICAVIPVDEGKRKVSMSAVDEKVRTAIGDTQTTIDSGTQKEFKYVMYFGPKKLSILDQAGYNLSHAVNFGFFDVLAKPMLWLLNFFHTYLKNYGVAIILVTIMIKGVFWPITQKGMKSMKNMQKLQPKVAKLKEKFKDDPQKMNQEMMAMYKTYKVNPLGGCLPMFLQIPFFFALYKVLLMSIELRHAPFMLWINDLSAPDRLWVGFDIPYLHGIPVLTLLMGASMYLQQKMTPTTADPTQAKIMQMLPIIFTFMFLNFASGLVLYWFVNNLLSILQQKLINRQARS